MKTKASPAKRFINRVKKSSYQRLFDIAAQGMRKQSYRPALHGLHDGAVFENSQGLRCAVGHIMGDDAKTLSRFDNPSEIPGWNTIVFWKRRLLLNMLRAHDNSTSDMMPAALARVAAEFELDASVVE